MYNKKMLNIMKKTFRMLPVLGMLVLASCTSTDSLDGNVSRVVAQLPAFLDEGGTTRTQINVSDADKISYTWAVGDVLGIFPDEGDQVSFRLTEESLSGTSASFDGGAWALRTGHSYAAYFPFSYDNFSATTEATAIPVSYLGQSASAWGSTESAGHYDYNAAGSTSVSGSALTFSFTRLGALLRIHFTLPATATYQSVTLSADANVIPVSGTVNLTAASPVYVPGTYASSLTYTLDNISGTKNQSVYVYLMLPPMTLNTQGKTLTATLTYSSGSQSYDLCKAGTTTAHTPDFKANTIYKRDAIAQSVNPGGEMSGGDEEGDDELINGHAYVDLGLPSGILWATCNVGAENAGDYGDYFAWGETTGYNSGKTDFSWSTYKYCEGSYTTLTKYCSNSSYGYNGFTDELTVLESSDDAATANWGGSWRMPTHAEWEELCNTDNCTWEWTTQYGHNGYKVTSNANGNSIFLPAAGDRVGTSLGNAGSYGVYWSSSLYESYPGIAWSCYFDSSYHDADDGDYRCYGRSVRPVSAP